MENLRLHTPQIRPPQLTKVLDYGGVSKEIIDILA
jgi:hypothetical protein